MTAERSSKPDATTTPRARPSRPSGVRAKPIASGRLHGMPAYRANASARREASRDDSDDVSGVALCAHETASPVPSGTQARESLLAEVTRLLGSSLDYTAALRDLAQVVAERLGCGCVVDVFEPGGSMHLAHVAPSLRPITQDTLAPLVGEVVARGTPVLAVRHATMPGTRESAAAERARRKLGAAWLICVPLAAHPGVALGTLSIFGREAHQTPVSTELARELGRRMAVAIENGRLYRAALVAAREREQILALVAHELKNPLGVILMSTARARLGSPGGGARCTCADRELDVIHRSAARMKKLVGDLLDLSSVDAGKLSMKPGACELASLIRSAIRDVSPAAAATAVTVVEDLPSDLPSAWIDGDRIAQVLVNLLSNAIKFTPRGGRVRVRATPLEGEIVVAIEDSGCGIGKEDLERVFDRFWQASETAKLGSGLGLGICKSIVELSGGRIWVQSTVGVGTTFYFAVPSSR